MQRRQEDETDEGGWFFGIGDDGLLTVDPASRRSGVHVEKGERFKAGLRQGAELMGAGGGVRETGGTAGPGLDDGRGLLPGFETMTELNGSHGGIGAGGMIDDGINFMRDFLT